VSIGERIRQARTARQLSLNDVATRAHISVATLSRIERDKQGLDLGLFLNLSKILKATPHELIGGDDGANLDLLAARIAALSHDERLKLWRDLAAERRSRQRNGGRWHTRTLSDEVDELLAQMEYVRAEMEGVSARVRRH